jgi:hypothetical protein
MHLSVLLEARFFLWAPFCATPKSSFSALPTADRQAAGHDQQATNRSTMLMEGSYHDAEQ